MPSYKVLSRLLLIVIFGYHAHFIEHLNQTFQRIWIEPDKVLRVPAVLELFISSKGDFRKIYPRLINVILHGERDPR